MKHADPEEETTLRFDGATDKPLSAASSSDAESKFIDLMNLIITSVGQESRYLTQEQQSLAAAVEDAASALRQHVESSTTMLSNQADKYVQQISKMQRDLARLQKKDAEIGAALQDLAHRVPDMPASQIVPSIVAVITKLTTEDPIVNEETKYFLPLSRAPSPLPPVAPTIPELRYRNESNDSRRLPKRQRPSSSEEDSYADSSPPSSPPEPKRPRTSDGSTPLDLDKPLQNLRVVVQPSPHGAAPRVSRPVSNPVKSKPPNSTYNMSEELTITVNTQKPPRRPILQRLK